MSGTPIDVDVAFVELIATAYGAGVLLGGARSFTATDKSFVFTAKAQAFSFTANPKAFSFTARGVLSD